MLPQDKAQRFYVCSVKQMSGWMYYAADGSIRLSQDYPDDYEAYIGYKYGHGAGKTDADGTPKEDKASPDRVLLMRLWSVDQGKMVAAAIDRSPLQKQIAKDFSNPQYYFEQDDAGACVSNFYLEFVHDSRPIQKALTYTVTSHLRPTTARPIYEAAAKPWYPENYWRSLNPFEAPTTPPEKAGIPVLPATVSDENGAEEEVAEPPITDEPQPVW